MTKDAKPLAFLEWQLLRFLAALGYKKRPEPQRDSAGKPQWRYLQRDSKGQWSAQGWDFTHYVRNAANSLLARGLIDVQYDETWSWTDSAVGKKREQRYTLGFGLNDAGRAMALVEPPTRSVKVPPMTVGAYEVLHDLRDAWKTPQDFGGGNGSHHSGSAMILVRNGFAETKPRYSDDRNAQSGPLVKAPSIFRKGRGSRVYRLAAPGKILRGERIASREAKRRAKRQGSQDG